MPKLKKKVVIGMSGGVDSSVAAYLLKEQGYEVIGVTMQMWHDNAFNSSESRENLTGKAVEDARKVASALGIVHYVMDFGQCFEEKVIKNFINEYIAGRTPNPCVVCNRHVKWEALLQRAASLGAEYIATGHYARITECANGRYAVYSSVTEAKDQTYALYNLTQEQLAHTLMPIGEFDKDEIRKIASTMNLEVASKPDSMEICFIPDNDYASFICRRTGHTPKEGNYVDLSGNIIGRHRGIIHYTVGQRKGLGLSMGEPCFVTEIRPETNEIVIGKSSDVMSNIVYADKLNFMAIPEITDGMNAVAKIRYSHKGAPCRLYMNDKSTVKCVFNEAQRAVTPGQALVFYNNGIVLGGGTIIKV